MSYIANVAASSVRVYGNNPEINLCCGASQLTDGYSIRNVERVRIVSMENEVQSTFVKLT